MSNRVGESLAGPESRSCLPVDFEVAFGSDFLVGVFQTAGLSVLLQHGGGGRHPRKWVRLSPRRITEMDVAGEYDPTWITGKDLERHFALEDALLEFSHLFKHEEKNDRGLVIVGAAFLDTLLEDILINFLVDDPKEVAELLQYDQPLGTYGSRTRAAYCFGLIGKSIRDDLRLVGRIRNKFAHELSATFDDQQIAAWCVGLKWHRIAYVTPPPDASARDLFHVGVNQLVCHLNGIVSVARGKRG